MKRFSILAVVVLAVQSLYAGNGPVWKAADPIAGEYIVVLADQKNRAVDTAADALAKAHGGSVIVTMKNGVKAFGMRMNEHQAEALARNPLVDRLEERTGSLSEAKLCSKLATPECSRSEQVRFARRT